MATSKKIKHELAVGQQVEFTGYGQALPDGMAPVLNPGERVTVTELSQDEEGNPCYEVVNEAGAAETVFYPQEVKLIEDAPATTTRRGRAAAGKDKTKATTGAGGLKGGDAAKAKADAKAAKEKAKAEAKAAKEAEKEAKTQITITDTQAVTEALSESKSALDAAKALVLRTEETFFTLGGVLAHIYYEGLYTSLGYEGQKGFAEYISTELGVDYRKAMYLINIYTHFTALGIDESKVVEMGWSKAKELIGVADTKTAFNKLSKYALTHSKDDLIEHIKSEYKKDSNSGGQQSSGRTKRTTFKFRAYEDQATVVQQIVEQVAADITDKDVDAAFVHIVTEWATLSEAVDIPLEDAIINLEHRYKVKLAEVTE